MVGNIAQNQEQINFVIVFSTIICVSMVLLITSAAIFVDHIKVASEQSNPWLMGKCSPGVAWMIYLAWKLQFLEMAAKLWPSFLWIGQMEMVSMSLCWNAKVGRSHWTWDKQLLWSLGSVKMRRGAKTEFPLLKTMQPGSQPWHFRIVFRTWVSWKDSEVQAACDCSELDHFLHVPVCMPKASGAANVYETFFFKL